jgi:hypothetical protein
MAVRSTMMPRTNPPTSAAMKPSQYEPVCSVMVKAM